MLTLTTSAVNYILNIMQKQELTVEVTEQGCAVYTYNLSERVKTSNVLINGITVFYDPKYEDIINDTIVDFVEEGLNKFFKITNANAVNTCGCGISFSLGTS